MAKKRRNTSYRAQQNRKRNLEKAEARRKAAASRAFWQAHGLKIAIASAAAVILILAVWLGCKWFVGPGGSLPNFFGNLHTAESDWIISDTSVTNKPRYYKLGEMSAPEGYTLSEDFQVSSDNLIQNFFYEADDENEPVKTIYVSGVANNSAENMLAMVSSYNLHLSMGEAMTANIGGHDVHYRYFVYGDTETGTDDNGDGTIDTYTNGYSSLCLYTDAVEDSCVLMLINSQTVALEDVAAEDVLLAKAEEVMPLLTVEK